VATTSPIAGRSCLTDKTPSQLPTPAELSEALKQLEEAHKALIHVAWLVARIARGSRTFDSPEQALVDGDEHPTWAHIGRLHLFVRDVDGKIGDLKSTYGWLRGETDELAILVEEEERRDA
jgi:hypothetical protein